MKNAKPKRTRQDAERLFEGLPQTSTAPQSRSANPFEDGAFEKVERIDEESKLWKDNLITLPAAIELPPGYTSVSSVREAMKRAWRVKWVREGQNEIVVEFPEGWAAVRPASGPIELRDPAGVVRAVYGWAQDAELRILPRYAVESQSNSTSGLGSVLVRDRESGEILERSSTWSAQTGTNHPDRPRLSTWLDVHYPQHRDPMRLWKDCEDNIGNWVGP
ncbi:hypothetical protein BWP39_28915 [Paraburkholderia acidicola]|uniref:Nitroreductase n=1 Tax=Paraburkholderia acidicola TaxID=1912599 RepID=A0A2A4EPZ3_9BURK|nr:hypothetical protein [Paraburkholderia acidicola]PCE23703.1 hypothetical protein BWP39_28915 [Paraburkholderia acidicola]